MRKFLNFILFPLIVCACYVFLRRGAAYKNFRFLAYEKMYTWQWRLLDKLMGYEDERK